MSATNFLRARLEAEADALDRLVATCESELHAIQFGCPFCRRDTRQRDLLREAAAALLYRCDCCDQPIMEAIECGDCQIEQETK